MEFRILLALTQYFLNKDKLKYLLLGCGVHFQNVQIFFGKSAALTGVAMLNQ